MSGGKFHAAGRFPETRVPRVLNDIYIPRLPPIIDINVKLLAYDNNNERNRVGVFRGDKSASRNAHNTCTIMRTDKFGGGEVCKASDVYREIYTMRI